MYRHYLKNVWRHFKRHKGYSFINISGLAIGLACFILILIYVRDELSYDRYHKNATRIYRLAFTENREYKTVNYPITSGGIAPALIAEVPDVLNAVRFMRPYDQLVTWRDRQFYEERIFYADASVFDVFSFSLIQGDAKTALAEPGTVVITRDMARKYFGDEDPMGKVLTLGAGRDFTVTGVLRGIPRNSHFRFDMLFSMKSLEKDLAEEWRRSSCYTYLMVNDHFVPSDFEAVFPDFFKKYRVKGDQRQFYLQPLTAIHLHSHLEREIEPNSDIAYIYILSTIALFVLLIACLNFVNLSTARSANRAKEVGMRKVAGASRARIVRQFLAESILMTALALVLALCLIQVVMPAFNRLADKELALGLLNPGLMILGLAAITVAVGAAAGAYPAFFLSAFEPVRVLMGRLKVGPKGSSFRKILVLIQFSLSSFLIIGTIVTRRQLDFIQNKNLGFDKDQVVVVPAEDRGTQKAYPALKTELLRSSKIAIVSAATNVPGMSINHDFFIPEGQDKEVTIGHILVDYGYIQSLGLEIKEGRDFSAEHGDVFGTAHLLNEAAATMLGRESAVGKRLTQNGRVIGVVKNFHFLSKYQAIDPLVISLFPPDSEYIGQVIIKIHPGSIKETLDFLENKWRMLVPGRPMNYYFLDEYYEALYRREQKLSSVFSCFAGLAVFIACLGLFGLASFTAEQRKKEIGIRKVLGASAAGLVGFLSMEFTKWVVLANVIACPVAYCIMGRWLRNFAYRISIGAGVFALAVTVAMVIAFFTVSFQAVRAALANPVDSLRCE
jgi:putative ABC transport system permease protein